MDLIGYDYIWKLVTECNDDTVADDITEYLLKISYSDISAKLKKDARQLHQRFIDRCYHQLKAVIEGTTTTVPTKKAITTSSTESSTVLAMQQGFELETCSNLTGEELDDSKKLTRLRNRSSTEPSTDIGEDSGQTINRLIHLLERYVSVVEDGFHAKRQILPHAATFLGRPLVLKVTVDVKKEEFEMQCHSNELIGDMKKRVAEKLQKRVGDMTFDCSRQGILGTNKDNLLLNTLEEEKDDEVVAAKTNTNSGELEWTVTIKDSSTALVVFDDSASSASTSASNVVGGPFHQDDPEKSLPGVLMMSHNHVIFPLLYKLSAAASTFKDSKASILSTLSRLLHKLPTDTNVIEDFESIEMESNLSIAADASPKVSPRKTASSREIAAETIHKLLDPIGIGMSALRVWYNLSVLSSRLMPIQGCLNPLSFTQQFQKANGLKAVLQIFNKDYLPPDTEREMRQSIYVLSLQITRCLLCGTADNMASTSSKSLTL